MDDADAPRVLVELPAELATELVEANLALVLPRVRADVTDVVATVWTGLSQVSVIVALLQVPQTVDYLREALRSLSMKRPNNGAVKLKAVGPGGTIDLTIDETTDLKDLDRLLRLLLIARDS